ncbi:telomerase RNA component interacting RNase-like [Daphnia carinata]|uniref:telomerase RNA component interacting RNase-like n=1 Tax=Daphnia carinata TaxID=120202 RepID=UPI00258061E1|nr:telomerase RNA component interacting RNase-like [Daphnia carinata]
MASPREDGELLESSSSSDEENSEEEESGKPGQNAVKFKNDGSFLEMFKKMQESNQQSPQVPEKKDVTQLQMKNPDNPSAHAEPSHTEKDAVPPQPAQKKPGLMSLVGKRRGGKSLPVGVVKKQKRPEEEEESSVSSFSFSYLGKTDAWSQYMSEVKKYKERLGDEEEKNRPLVK